MKRILHFLFKKHLRISGGIIILLLLGWWFCLPDPLFRHPTSMVLEDREEQLLGARIATDGQWRFPQNDTVPDKFAQAIITFEDKRFYQHPGIDLFAMFRAVRQNLREGRVVSGGSTLSMQTIRMARAKKGRGRTIFQKIIEAIWTTRLEVRYSKPEILSMYASNAPFGGNVVGLDAAAWRYYSKRPDLLSWAEAATLAVLPNSPALIHPGRNRKALFEKRNRLLKKLQEAGHIDEMSYSLAIEEDLPRKPKSLPRLAPHLLDRAFAEQFRGQSFPHTRLQTTLSGDLQTQANRIANAHHLNLIANGIHNLAILVLDVETGYVLAYVGNAPNAGARHGGAVDIITAPRSSGSILKPFLYALMQQEGNILPSSLIQDIPTSLAGYQPENYHKTYDGMVAADKALARSLNVPMVRMLQDYGLTKFHRSLNQIGFTTITKSPDHYGLPLILGGAEVKLWDITNAFACMGRSLSHFYPYNGQYNLNDFRTANYIHGKKLSAKEALSLQPQVDKISAAASWLTFKAMQEVERPNSEGEWEYFRSSKPIAWKTGTSYGFRDAWAVGLTPKYAVGVWVGNADGEGRPGLVGVKAAAPILFDIFEQLPPTDWFEQPFDEMSRIPVCRQSGYRAGLYCEVDSLWVANPGLKVKACPFHQLVHLNTSEREQVNSQCESPMNMVHKNWFVLPPVEEYYYKSRFPDYTPLPPFRTDCAPQNTKANNGPMQFIYPQHASKIYIPVDLDGEQSRTVFKIAHRTPETEVHWHLDNEYLGSTKNFHHLELNPSSGKHLLTLVDDSGNQLIQRFEIIRKK